MDRPAACHPPTDANPSNSKLGTAVARELTSVDLLQGSREVLIRHGDDLYRLRLTRNGKLILHK